MTPLRDESAEVEAQVREMLKDTLTPRGIEQFLDGESRYLGGRCARDVLKTDPQKVLAAVDALVSGAYL